MTAAERLAAEISGARVEHARADTKASVLLGTAGVASGLLAANWYGWPGMAAVAAWAVCGGLALLVLVPRIPRSTAASGFLRWANATPDEVLAALAAGAHDGPAALVGMSRLALTKYRLVQAAAVAGMVALALTAGAVL